MWREGLYNANDRLKEGIFMIAEHLHQVKQKIKAAMKKRTADMDENVLDRKSVV